MVFAAWVVLADEMYLLVAGGSALPFATAFATFGGMALFLTARSEDLAAFQLVDCGLQLRDACFELSLLSFDDFTGAFLIVVRSLELIDQVVIRPFQYERVLQLVISILLAVQKDLDLRSCCCDLLFEAGVLCNKLVVPLGQALGESIAC